MTYKKLPFHFGWIIAFAAMCVTFVWGCIYSYGVFFKPLETEFGWTRAELSSAVSIFLLVYSVCVLLFGKLTDRYGPRVTIALGGFLAGLGIALCSSINLLWQLRVFFGIAGIGTSALYVAPAFVVQKWFVQKRKGLALGIISAGVGVGTLLFAPLAANLIGLRGWRDTFLIFGLGIWALLSLAAIVIRSSPSHMKLSPYGIESEPSSKEWQGASLEKSEGFTPKQALVSSSFRLLYLAYFFGSVSQMMSFVHLVRFGIDIGMTEALAATTLGILGAFSVFGKVGAGLLSDKIGRRQALILAYIIQSIAMLWLVFTDSSWMLFVFTVLLGLAYGGWVTTYPAILSDYFGSRALGTILACGLTAWGIAGAVGPVFGGYIFDVTGNYATAFLTGFITSVLALVTILFVRSPEGNAAPLSGFKFKVD